MNCSMSVPLVTLLYSGPGNVNAPQCIAENKYCTPVKGYNASVVNATYSRLRILSIQPYHAGRWTCKIIPDGPSASCNLVTTKTPTCNISSDNDTDALAKYQELSLTVDIRDYFCSAISNFALQTGNVTTPLPIAEHVTRIISNITAATFNVTNSHLGIVGLIYNCHNKQWDITCHGVTELKTPTCSITSDKDTDRLVLNEELTLSVDFHAYNCPVVADQSRQGHRQRQV
ncbi:uncharacterized protein LOC125375926 [Haliotis rufescens]|uniref:uncharacterized protein LOC125375926 n=1 Tax=Haliotis rufescens TaxID=6454 RepID=UPI00201F95F2|nr:uncharacterized protein LOC125375926 [Haliotis rufescens]